MPATILVVDDEPIIRETLAEFLTGEGFDVEVAPDGETALIQSAKRYFDVMLCDVNLPGLDGIEVLERVGKISPETFVVLITAYGTIESAIEAFQKGAQDYLLKPILLNEVAGKVRRFLKTKELHLENARLRRELSRVEDAPFDLVVGRSLAMRQAFELARKIGPTPATVLILGESGTGKELFARALHRFSQESKPTEGRFLPLNCAAIPRDLLESQLFGHRKGAYTGADRDAPGVFSHAGKGTVFLDEIGEMPLETQAKLLRVLEQKEVFPVGANEPVKVEARILAATNKDLAREVAEGRFREDLYYRLNVLALKLPPLRERSEDIPELLDHLLHKHAGAIGKRFTGFTHEAMSILLAHRWKGNVRELDNVVQRAVILGDGPLVTPLDLPTDVVPQPDDPFACDDLGVAVARFERMVIERALRATWDKKETARRLGIGLSSLYRKIEQYGIGAAPPGE